MSDSVKQTRKAGDHSENVQGRMRSPTAPWILGETGLASPAGFEPALPP